MITGNSNFRVSTLSSQFIPLISLPAEELFRRVLSRFLSNTMPTGDGLAVEHAVQRAAKSTQGQSSGLKKIPPYWYPYTTMAKGRWLGREILEVVSTEFRDRSMEYYRYALESGVTTINGKVAKPDNIIRNGDRIENVVHRHEPPVTSRPVKVLLHDPEREFIVVDKPGSIPVHASGRYYRNTLVEILKNDFGYDQVYTVNRLDRLTSGLLIIPLTPECARTLTDEFMAGTVRKEYIARCKGEFPVEETTCEEPLLTVDRQMGLNIVHPEGKPAKTIFNRLHYDANTDTSVIHCQPLTGRSHQLRVHLQYLGYPIANDPIYSETKIWGPQLGHGGIDLVPSQDRSAPVPPPHITPDGNPESLSNFLAQHPTLPTINTETTSDGGNPRESNITTHADASPSGQSSSKLLPRETGQDIGMGSPVPLSSEAVGVITRLRNMKDEDEDWSRWRDVVFRAKGALTPQGIKIKPLPPQNRRERGGPAFVESNTSTEEPPAAELTPQESPSAQGVKDTGSSTPPCLPQLSVEEAFEKLGISSEDFATSQCSEQTTAVVTQDRNTYCPECYLPLHPDPKPERLYIFLHALRYTTSLGCFETEMPEWAAKGWVWDRS